jgi:hypothetical protein
MPFERICRLLIPALLLSGLTLLTWQYGAYIGDDRHALFPVAKHSVVFTIEYLLRPIEYFILQLFNQVEFQAWPIASLLLGITTAHIQVRTIERMLGQTLRPALYIAAVVGSPLWFQLLSQVDTISQCVCNLMLAVCLHQLFTGVLPGSDGQASRAGALVNVGACVLLFSKELALAAAVFIPFITAILVWRRRGFRAPLYLASLVLVACALIAWVYLKLSFRSFLPESEGHYGFSPSPEKFATNLISLVGFPITPLPTSLLSFKDLAVAWQGAAGASLAILGLTLWKLARRPNQVRGKLGLLILLLGGCSAPIVIIHSSELYATLLTSYLVGLMACAWSDRPWLVLAYSLALLGCSYANALIYFHAEDAPWKDIPRVEYSLYEGHDGRHYQGRLQTAFCPIRGTHEVRWACGKLQCLPYSSRITALSSGASCPPDAP